MHTIAFEHPLILFWIVPAWLALWLTTLRTHASLAPDQVRQSLLLRCAVAALVIIAAAAPVVAGPSRDESVAFLIDASSSISPTQRASEFAWVQRAIAHKPGGDMVCVEEFGADTDLLMRPTRTPSGLSDTVGVDPGATDIGAAIANAASVMDTRLPRQIVVLTDGNETTGSAMQAAADAGIPISFVNDAALAGSAETPEASIVRVDFPSVVHEGEAVYAHVIVDSSVAQHVSIAARCEGAKIATVTQAIGVGKSVVNVPVVLRGAGIRQVNFALNAPLDTVPDNNVGAAAVKVIGKPRILFLTDNAQTMALPIARALSKQSIDLDVMPPLDAPSDAVGFAAYDSVVVDNLDASELSPEQQSALQSAVRDYGDGFGMIGGDNGYIAGGWADTVVEQMLPVEMKMPKQMLPPPADIVVVLDASGSMSAEEDGVEKVQLAARAAVSLLGNLQPNDRVCVLAVTTEAVVTVPFSSPQQAMAAREDIEGLEADGGGIYCLTGLNAAYELLNSSSAPIKHVIICPDTSDSEQQEDCVERAAQELHEHDITTSVCGIGEPTDSDVPFQRALAAAGGGQSYVVTQATDMPHFFQRDLVNLTIPPIRTGNFHMTYDDADRVVGGLNVGTVPNLLGYDISLAKPSANVPIKTGAYHEPIFAYEDYGLGRTFAYTSDDGGAWSRLWLRWPGYASFWTRVMRWSLRNEKPANFDAFVDLPSNSSTGHIIVDAFDSAGNFVNGAAFQAKITPPGSPAQILNLNQTAPGRYEAQFDGSHVGGYLVSVTHVGAPDDGVQTLGAARAYSPEFAQEPVNLSLISAVSQASGGKIFGDPLDLWRFRPGTQQEQFDLASLSLIAGMLIFLLDIAWRLLGLRIKTRRLSAASGAIAARAVRLRSGIAGFMQERTSDEIPKQRVMTKPAVPTSRQARSGESAYSAEEDAAFLRGRSAGSAEESFPLVASLDELRRRERAKDRN